MSLELAFNGELAESIDVFTNNQVVRVGYVVVVSNAFDDAKTLFECGGKFIRCRL